MKKPILKTKVESEFETDNYTLELNEVDSVRTRVKEHRIGAVRVLETSKIILVLNSSNQVYKQITLTSIEVKKPKKQYKGEIRLIEFPVVGEPE